MIKKIDKVQMYKDALISGDYDGFIQRVILEKINELIDEVNDLK